MILKNFQASSLLQNKISAKSFTDGPAASSDVCLLNTTPLWFLEVDVFIMFKVCSEKSTGEMRQVETKDKYLWDYLLETFIHHSMF